MRSTVDSTGLIGHPDQSIPVADKSASCNLKWLRLSDPWSHFPNFQEVLSSFSALHRNLTNLFMMPSTKCGSELEATSTKDVQATPGPPLIYSDLSPRICLEYRRTWHFYNKGRFTDETECPWPPNSETSHSSKRPRPSKFTFTLHKGPKKLSWNENSTWDFFMVDHVRVNLN